MPSSTVRAASFSQSQGARRCSGEGMHDASWLRPGSRVQPAPPGAPHRTLGLFRVWHAILGSWPPNSSIRPLGVALCAVEGRSSCGPSAGRPSQAGLGCTKRTGRPTRTKRQQPGAEDQFINQAARLSSQMADKMITEAKVNRTQRRVVGAPHMFRPGIFTTDCRNRWR